MALLWAPVVAAYLTLLSSVLGCGVPAIRPSVRFLEQIVSGQNAVPGSWPWQVSIQTNSGFHFCGGSLINQNWVVTAAHCDPSPGKHQVVLGEYDLTSNAEPVQVKTIAKVITHPYWNTKTLLNDIALVKLSSPAQLNSRVSPVCLASDTENLPPGLKCMTTGWGLMNFNIKTPAPKLQQTVMPLAPFSECQKTWDKDITSAVVCAGGAGGITCKGDSGGPLVCLKGSSWNLVGVVSWGSENCDVRVPTAYTRVSKFRSWIDQIITRY